LFNGDWDAALSAFQAVLDQSTAAEVHAAALFGLGKTYFLRGDPTSALDFFRNLVDAQPEPAQRAEAFFLLGESYEALGRSLDAADAYLNYLALRPGLIDGYLLERRGDNLFAANDYNGALKDYTAALASPRLESSPDLEIKIARTYGILGDSPTALVTFDDIYNRSSSEYIKAQVDYLKGQLYAATGQTDLAYPAYTDAVVNFPQYYDSYLSLVELVNAGSPVDELQRGIVDYYAQQYGVALEAFDRYLASSPVNPAAAYYFKGLTLMDLQDYAGALEMYNQVIQNYTTSEYWDNAWEEKAYTLWAYLDQYNEAKDVLLSFVETAPGHPRAGEFLFDAAQIAERSGSLEEAANLWRRAGTEYPASGQANRAYFLAGIAGYRRGDYTMALDDFRRAQSVASGPFESSAAALWIGKVYQASGDIPTAQSVWQQTASIDPTGYYSERALDLMAGRAPFSPPANFDLGRDVQAEKIKAETWMRSTFNLPPEVDLSNPGKLADDARFQRGQEFWKLGLFNEASQEFDSLRLSLQADPANLYRLANYLVDLGFYRPAILAARQVLDDSGMSDATNLQAPDLFSHIRFGTYYPDLVIPAAQSHNFHPLFVWSVIRQESFFERSIRSSAGARGLMQIVPSTGQDIANRIGWPPGYTADDLDRPLVNITLGLDYLNDQLNYLDGDIYAALAGYNAGPGNANEWKKLSANDPDLLLEIIRWDEPRQYIQRIYENYVIYRKLYERLP